MTLLLAKIIVSVCVVLGLSWVAEHVNSRIAGILSGMPLGAVLILFFVGRELGPEFAQTSALYAIPSIVATIAFAIGYYFASGLKIRFSPLFSSLFGVTCYFIVAAALNTLSFTMLTGVCLSLATLIVTAYAFRTSETNKIENKVRMTFPRMMFRSAMAASFVVAITTFADVVGPQWSGLLIGFPMTFLPFLLIIHMTYSADQVRAILRNFPIGLVGLLSFLIVATKTIPLLGVNLAILASIGGALAYLSILGLILNRKKPAPAQH